MLTEWLKSSALMRDLDETILEELAAHCELVSLAGGEKLMEQGEPGDCLYLILNGRLRFRARSELRTDVLVGEAGPGETVGEMSLLTGEPRSATVFAIRYTRMLKLDREQFQAVVDKYPKFAIQLARMIVLRQQRLRSPLIRCTPRTIAVLAASDSVPLGEFAAQLAGELSRFGSTSCITRETLEREFGPLGDQALADSSGPDNIAAWMSDQELCNDLLLFVGDAESGRWNRRFMRQADVILFVGDAEAEAPPDWAGDALTREFPSPTAPPVDVALLHPSSSGSPSNTQSWLKDSGIRRLYHLRRGVRADLARLSRLLLDRGIAVVLGGGGARGFAHIGAVRALQESGLPVDLLGGCSMGALIAAQWAFGLDWREILEGNRRMWIKSGGVFDFTLPLIALIAGRKSRRLISKTFRDTHIEDLWTNYFCVTADLTNAELAVHRRGLLWKAILASTSLPGIAPPQLFNGDLHSDGGLLDNLPVETMRSMTGGPILAVDVGLPREVTADPDLPACPSGTRLLLNRLNPLANTVSLPNILTILARSALLSSVKRTEMVRQQADLYVRPSVEKYKIFQFDALDDVVERGYEIMLEHLERWRSQVTGLV